MYRTSLSWLPIRRHLTLLVEKGFLKESSTKGRKVYDITESGKRFLKHIHLAKKELAEGEHYFANTRLDNVRSMHID